MKKILVALGLLAILALSLTACGDNAISANPVLNADNQILPKVAQPISYADSQLVPIISLPEYFYQDGWGFAHPPKIEYYIIQGGSNDIALPQITEIPDDIYQDGWGFTPPQRIETYTYRDGWGFPLRDGENYPIK